MSIFSRKSKSDYTQNDTKTIVNYSCTVPVVEKTVQDAVSDLNTGAISFDMATRMQDSELNNAQALKLETVFTCISKKATSIGQLPVKLYRIGSDRRVENVTSGRAVRLFTKNPCDYLSMGGFLEMVSTCLDMNGAFYAYVERNDRGNIMGIIPFANQGNIQPAMDTYGNVFYTYTTNDGKYRDPYALSDLFIVKGFTFNGFTPVSPIRQNGLMLGISDAQERTYSELQKSGITSQMGLVTDAAFNDANAVARLKEDFRNLRGVNGFKTIPLFENGLKPISLKLNPMESDLLNHREFSVNRICRIFNVPVEIAGVAGKTSTKSTMAEINESFMTQTLNPILVKIEFALNSLLPDDLRVKIDRKAFYQGSPWQMVTSVEKELKGGLCTVNEGRIDLGRDPVEGADVFAVDSNNVTYGTWEELKAIQAQLFGQSKQSKEVKDNE